MNCLPQAKLTSCRTEAYAALGVSLQGHISFSNWDLNPGLTEPDAKELII